MWRNRKFILPVLAGALLVVGLIGGVALAQDDGGSTAEITDDSRPKILERVAEILGIDQQQLEDAFAQARTEMQDSALRDYLDKLVAEDRITQEEADEYYTWWNSRPDLTQYQEQLKAWKEAKPGIPPEFEEWMDATPDMPLPRSFDGFGMRASRILRGGLGFFGGR